jgi:long-subunit acyl-CoA synthetase (AMP-forming)
MITNDNITWTVPVMLRLTRKGTMDETDVMISYLPLSHIAAQILDLHCPLYSGTQMYFAQPDALKGSLGKTLVEVRPTAFFGVPRVWEKVYGTSYADRRLILIGNTFASTYKAFSTLFVDKLQEVAKSTTGVQKRFVHLGQV